MKLRFAAHVVRPHVEAAAPRRQRHPVSGANGPRVPPAWSAQSRVGRTESGW